MTIEMQVKLLGKLNINAFCLAAYLLIVSTYIGVLAYWYSVAVSELQSNRAKTHQAGKHKKDQLSLARGVFFRYVSLNQAKLRDARNANTPEFLKAQQLLSNIHSDLLLMLGSTAGSCRDLMITTKVCSAENSCPQCLLLLREAPVLQNIRFGLGPHPHHLRMRVPEYHFKNACYSVDPSKIRYAVSPTSDGVNVTLFCDDLLNQNEWSADFSEFEPQYKPADLFLDGLLGEYLRKHVREISIRGRADPAFNSAVDCWPPERFRKDVAIAGNIPITIPAVSDESYIFHSLDSEKNSTRAVSGWYEDWCNWSSYLNSNDPQQYQTKHKDGTL